MWIFLSLFAVTLEVPADHPTIGDAVAVAVPGTIIEVSPGVYPEDLLLTSDLSLVAVGGPHVTRISGAGAATVVDVAGAAVDIEGFTVDGSGARSLRASGAATLTLTNIDCTGSAATGLAGGCLHVDASTVVVTGSRFYANDAEGLDGGHVAALTSKLTVSDSVFLDGVGRQGGAIYANDSSVTLERVRFDGNMGSQDGGSFYGVLGTVIIDDSWFFDSVSSLGGGGVSVVGASLTISDAIFVGNGAVEDGGGLLVDSCAPATISGAIFVDNVSDVWGGGVALRDSPGALLDTSWIATNEAPNLRGGGASIYGCAGAVIEDNAIFENRSGGASGGFHLELSADSLVRRNLVCGNVTEGSGLDGIGADAGGFMVQASDNTEVLNNIIVDNWANDDGGGVSNQNSYGPVVIRNNTVVGNRSGDGTGPSAPNIAGNLRTSNGDIEVNSSVVALARDDGGITLSYTSTVINDYNQFFANTGGDLVGGPTLGANDVTGADPLFVVFIDDGDCHNDDFQPDLGSPLLETGDPMWLDLDGSDNDRGATGGPSGDIRWYADADSDGFVDRDDCRPDDPAWSPATVWYEDADLDGFGAAATATTACVPPGALWVLDSNDCDDADPRVGTEQLWYEDVDLDGFGDPGSAVLSCLPPSGFVGDDTDCDDSDEDAFPGQIWYPDVDGDTYGDTTSPVVQCERLPGGVLIDGDCDDTDGTVNPDTVWYPDVDMDGLGDSASPEVGCVPSTPSVQDDSDCDDSNPAIGGPVDWWVDVDQDGFGDDAQVPTNSCNPPLGAALQAGDCDDDDPSLSPITVWFLDLDGDTYGDANTGATSCEPPVDGVAVEGDCNDADPYISPDADEVCNGVDDDCNGDIDIGAIDPETWYPDTDGDGWGDSSESAMLLCDVPEGYGPEGDCDDTESEVSPDGVETCDGRDEDCDDMVDEDPIDPLTWYRDQDGDGFGDDSDVVQACDVPEGYTDVGGDCDDTDSGLALDCSEDGRAFIPEEEESLPATEKGPAGCDCDSSGGRQGWAFIALAMLGGWRRRRRSAR